MAHEEIRQLQERVSAVFASGLRLTAAAEIVALAQTCAGLGIAQPAALLTQIHAHALTQAITQKDAEALIKALQIISQADLQLSRCDTVELATMQDTLHGLYLPITEAAQAQRGDLCDILALPNPFVLRRQLIRYYQTASSQELAAAIELAWCDYNLIPALRAGLSQRPDEALQLVSHALTYENHVIRLAALSVLQDLSRRPEYAPAALAQLQALALRVNDPLWHHWQKALAVAQGQESALALARQETLKTWQSWITQLRSPFKGPREFAFKQLAETKDPCLTEALAQALEHETDEKVLKHLLAALADIRGFAAIPAITPFLGGEYTKNAVETLSILGDRSVLTFIMNHLDAKAVPVFYQEVLARYGTLALPPLLAAIKRLDEPAKYKRAFASMLAGLRSDGLTQQVMQTAADDSIFATKLADLLRSVFPAQRKKSRKPPSGAFETARALIQKWLPFLSGGQRLATDGLSDLALSPNGAFLAIATARQIQIYDTTTWQRIARLPEQTAIRMICFAPDNRRLAVVKFQQQTVKNVVEIWEHGTGERCADGLELPCQIESIGFTGSGQYFLIGRDTSVLVVDAATWREVCELPGHGVRVSYVQAVPHSNMILTGDWNGKLCVWDETDWHQIATLKADSWAPRFASLTADGRRLVYGGHIGFKIWDTQSWQEVASSKKPANLNCAVVSPDGAVIVAGTEKNLRVFGATDWQELLVLENDVNISALRMLADGKRLLTWTRHEVKVWNLDLTMLAGR